MPVYLYRCRKCGHKYELLQTMGNKADEEKCPLCGTKGPERFALPFSDNDIKWPSGGFKFG